MTIYRYDMTIPVRVVSALHSGGVDEVSERPITDEDGRTVPAKSVVVPMGGGGESRPVRSIKGAIRAAFEEHMDRLDFSEEELKSLWGGEMRREVGTRKEQRGGGTDESLPLRASALTFHHAVVWDRTRGDLPHRMSTAIDRATGRGGDGRRLARCALAPRARRHDFRDPSQCRSPGPDPRTPRRQGCTVHNTEQGNKGNTACAP